MGYDVSSTHPLGRRTLKQIYSRNDGESPDRCIGWAPSRGRQCKNWRHGGYEDVQCSCQLTVKRLRSGLCRLHGYQAVQILEGLTPSQQSDCKKYLLVKFSDVDRERATRFRIDSTFPTSLAYDCSGVYMSEDDAIYFLDVVAKTRIKVTAAALKDQNDQFWTNYIRLALRHRDDPSSLKGTSFADIFTQEIVQRGGLQTAVTPLHSRGTVVNHGLITPESDKRQLQSKDRPISKDTATPPSFTPNNTPLPRPGNLFSAPTHTTPTPSTVGTSSSNIHNLFGMPGSGQPSLFTTKAGSTDKNTTNHNLDQKERSSNITTSVVPPTAGLVAKNAVQSGDTSPHIAQGDQASSSTKRHPVERRESYQADKVFELERATGKAKGEVVAGLKNSTGLESDETSKDETACGKGKSMVPTRRFSFSSSAPSKWPKRASEPVGSGYSTFQPKKSLPSDEFEEIDLQKREGNKRPSDSSIISSFGAQPGANTKSALSEAEDSDKEKTDDSSRDDSDVRLIDSNRIQMDAAKLEADRRGLSKSRSIKAHLDGRIEMVYRRQDGDIELTDETNKRPGLGEGVEEYIAGHVEKTLFSMLCCFGWSLDISLHKGRPSYTKLAGAIAQQRKVTKKPATAKPLREPLSANKELPKTPQQTAAELHASFSLEAPGLTPDEGTPFGAEVAGDAGPSTPTPAPRNLPIYSQHEGKRSLKLPVPTAAPGEDVYIAYKPE